MTKITKTQFASKLAKTAGLSQAQAESIVNIFWDLILTELQAGNEITFTGQGTFYVSQRKAREGRNPRTGEKITIPAGNSVGFRAGKKLKDGVNS